MTPIIDIEDYTWKYLNTQKPAIESISLQINEGEFVGIIGPNGSGKTTLALSIDGLIPGQYHGVKHGEVRVRGKEVEQYESGTLQRLIGMVFSDPESQFTAMTVEDELVFGMENLGMSIPEIRERLEWVTELTELGHLVEKPPYEISGGQKQRVALAAVLAMQPEIMILDEPTSMLDPLSRVRVFDVLAKLREEGGRTIVVIEHSLENLVPLTDRMVLLHNGKLVLEDETESFFENTELLLERGVFPPEVTQFFHWLIVDGKYSGKLPLSIAEAVEKLQRIVNQ
jgi:energy-coupling factor transporter ATP-binding protein EcfA2